MAEAAGSIDAIEAHAERAVLFAEWGRLGDAARSAAQALAGGLRNPDRLAACVAKLADARIPVAGISDDVVQGVDPPRLKMRADILRSQHRLPDAIALLRRALDAAPGDVALRMALADCLVGSGRDGEALECFERVVAVEPDHPIAWGHIAAIHALAGRYDVALDILERHRAHDSRIRSSILLNHAIARFHTGDTAGSLSELLALLPSDPDLDGHLQLGPSLLALGEFDEGWRQYEFRWVTGTNATRRPAWSSPHWNGQDLTGKTVLVIREQGIGDFFQFARYIPMLQERGAKVVLESFSPVRSIVNRLFPGAVVLDVDDVIPRHDYFAFLMSLPRSFGTTRSTIPPPLEGLAPLPDRADAWARSLPPSKGWRVGIVWAGRPEHLRDKQRSMALETLAPVLATPGIEFVGLQKGRPVVQCEALPESVDWTSVGPALDTLEDAIAVLEGIDLLVTVDTALAHIAATMGKPVWMLVAKPPDFRWLERGTTTPWYPAMRLFRQRNAGDWSEPVREIAADLLDWRNGGRRGPQRATTGNDPVHASNPTESPIGIPRGLARALPMLHGFVQYDPDEPLVGASLEHYGEWLDPIVGRLLSWVGEGAVVVEANPGAGAFSLPLARKIGANGQMLLFEPRAALRRMLGNNLRAHGVGRPALLARRLAGIDATAVTDVDTVDDLDLERLDLLLVNEGPAFDSSIVAGATETLWRCRPGVAVVAPDDEDARRVADVLRGHGYVAEVVSVPVFRPANFNRVDTDRTGGASRAVVLALPEEGPRRH